MMDMKSSRSKELLSKVYDHLDSIDVSKLSMGELKDFLGVVQQGQFLESFGQGPTFGLNNWGFGGCGVPIQGGESKQDAGSGETSGGEDE